MCYSKRDLFEIRNWDCVRWSIKFLFKDRDWHESHIHGTHVAAATLWSAWLTSIVGTNSRPNIYPPVARVKLCAWREFRGLEVKARACRERRGWIFFFFPRLTVRLTGIRIVGIGERTLISGIWCNLVELCTRVSDVGKLVDRNGA